jgi:hypothetical protein
LNARREKIRKKWRLKCQLKYFRCCVQSFNVSLSVFFNDQYNMSIKLIKYYAICFIIQLHAYTELLLNFFGITFCYVWISHCLFIFLILPIHKAYQVFFNKNKHDNMVINFNDFWSLIVE